MARFITEISKYLIVFIFALYTFECFSIFTTNNIAKKKRILSRQTFFIFFVQFVGNLVLYLNMEELNNLLFYLAQVVLILAVLILYKMFYPNISKLILNNMCMLITVGFVIIARLNYSKAWRQYIIFAVAFVISLAVPILINRMKSLENIRWAYAITGIIFLAIVLVLGITSGGAKLNISIAGTTIQLSELVKILFVFFVASSLKEDISFHNIIVTSGFAAFQILILVISRDLGAATILFITYIIMLFVATRNPLYLIGSLLAGSGASVIAYKIFNHVRVRVLVWIDPISTYDNGGYQIAQALFAIGTGGWFGLGLTRGLPDTIPVASEDFIFAAITEEMGIIFGIFLILICVSCYIMFLNIAMQLKGNFYKLVALGFGTCYMIQTFLNVGGVIKFIPCTGVTLPLVSYGGSSLLSTLIMFAIIQGLYILRDDESISDALANVRKIKRRKR